MRSGVGLLLALILWSCGDSRPRTDPTPTSLGSGVAAQEDAMASADTNTQQGQQQELVATFVAPKGPIASTTSGELTFVVENRGASPATLDLDQLGSAIFAMEFKDGTGQRIFTIPPGMPPASYKPRTETLQPKASRRFTVSLHVFSPPLRAGTYTARVQVEPIASETLRFEVSPGGP
jgi:hypothetical protein